MKNLFKLAISAILLIAIVFVLTGNQPQITQTDNSNVSGEAYENITIQVSIPAEDLRTYAINSTKDLKLEKVMEKLMNESDFKFKIEQSSFGSYITSVNDIDADSSSQFWSISINGQDAVAGISDIDPQDGDIITLTLKEF